MQVLEGRLQEMLAENEELRATAQKHKESHDRQREEGGKRAADKPGAHPHAGGQPHKGKMSTDEVRELEEARGRVFVLEGEVQRLSRKADVELMNQVVAIYPIETMSLISIYCCT
ncbi:hypothetical protein EON64_10780 [archaeon]|nr:MAG: hypothetical protein EON64_10780 [archaeon]